MGNGLRGLEGIECFEDFGEDLGEMNHLAEQSATSLRLDALLCIALLPLDVREIMSAQKGYGPVGREDVGRTPVNQRTPFILHIQRPCEAFSQPSFPRRYLPRRAVEVQTKLLSDSNKLRRGRPLITFRTLREQQAGLDSRQLGPIHGICEGNADQSLQFPHIGPRQ